MIKLVIFDWNGVLIADAIVAMRGGNEVIKAFGGGSIGITTYRATNTLPGTKFYSQHGCKETELMMNSQKVAHIFHEAYEKLALKIRTRGGAKQLLKWLNQHSVKSVILSNHTVSGITSQLKRLQIKEFFSQVIANDKLDSYVKGTTKKEKFEKILRLSNLKPSEIMIIGDSPEEVALGKSAGTITVAITHGHYNTKRLIDSHPDYLISNLKELIGIINKLQ